MITPRVAARGPQEEEEDAFFFFTLVPVLTECIKWKLVLNALLFFLLSPMPLSTSHSSFGVLLAITYSQIKPLISWWKRPEPSQCLKLLSHPFSTVSTHQSPGHAPSVICKSLSVYRMLYKVDDSKGNVLIQGDYTPRHRNKH